MLWPFVGIVPSIIHTIITFNHQNTLLFHWYILSHPNQYIRFHHGKFVELFKFSLLFHYNYASCILLTNFQKITRMFSKLPSSTVLFVYIRIQMPSARNWANHLRLSAVLEHCIKQRRTLTRALSILFLNSMTDEYCLFQPDRCAGGQ